ncbi:MAG: pilin [Clostridia bacterium]
MQKVIKILMILIVIILLINNFTCVYGAKADSDIKGLAESWLDLGREEAKKVGSESTKKWSDFNNLAGMLWGIGIFVILICGVIIGIKYMFSSLEEKASIKENLKPYIIGSVIIIGALGIWQLLVEFLDKI